MSFIDIHSEWLTNIATHNVLKAARTQRRELRIISQGKQRTTYDDGVYYYNNGGSSLHNHYFNDAKGTEYCTENDGQESGFKWSRTDGGEKNVKYDNMKQYESWNSYIDRPPYSNF